MCLWILEGQDFLLQLKPQQVRIFLMCSPGFGSSVLAGAHWTGNGVNPIQLIQEIGYQSCAHYMSWVVMTIENIPLSATRTLETWLCQSDDREIVFLAREITIFMTYDGAISTFYRPGCFITHSTV